jgi:tartrate-resistant acid phosphatase type 5
VGAQLVISGHDHTYERINHDGITYVVNGLGGAPRYNLGGVPVTGSQIFFNQDHGLCWLRPIANACDSSSSPLAAMWSMT